ncbi:MAG TPA: hypothetical protein VGB97_02570 [Candidatus Paceibacterota bacterium]|jgi:hypothetical protein
MSEKFQNISQNSGPLRWEDSHGVIHTAESVEQMAELKKQDRDAQ